MSKKPASRVHFIMFDVIYKDGSQRSNCKVPTSLLADLDGDEVARAFLEERERAIARKSGAPPQAIEKVCRSATERARKKSA